MHLSGINAPANHGPSKSITQHERLSPKHTGGLPPVSASAIGLTGLAVDSGAIPLAMIMPCPNISIAARQITQLSDRCKAITLFMANDPLCDQCISWLVAAAVLTSVARGDAPNFDMSDDLGHRSNDVATEAPVAGQRISTARSVAADDQQQARSSALFPAR
jgi:hypothetical protein